MKISFLLTISVACARTAFIRYVEALGRRDFIFDVLLDEAEFYLIGGWGE